MSSSVQSGEREPLFPGAQGTREGVLTCAQGDRKDAPPDRAGRGLRRPGQRLSSPKPGHGPPSPPDTSPHRAHRPRPRRPQPQPPRGRRHRPPALPGLEASVSGAPPSPAPVHAVRAAPPSSSAGGGQWTSCRPTCALFCANIRVCGWSPAPTRSAGPAGEARAPRGGPRAPLTPSPALRPAGEMRPHRPRAALPSARTPALHPWQEVPAAGPRLPGLRLRGVRAAHRAQHQEPVRARGRLQAGSRVGTGPSPESGRSRGVHSEPRPLPAGCALLEAPAPTFVWDRRLDMQVGGQAPPWCLFGVCKAEVCHPGLSASERSWRACALSPKVLNGVSVTYLKTLV